MASTTHQNLKGPDISYISVRVMICPKSQNFKAATWHLHINPIEWHIGTHTFYTNYLCTLSLDILIQPNALLTSLCQRYQPFALRLTSPWEWLNPSIVMCSCLYVDTNVLIVDNELWYSNLIPIDTPIPHPQCCTFNGQLNQFLSILFLRALACTLNRYCNHLDMQRTR